MASFPNPLSSRQKQFRFGIDGHAQLAAEDNGKGPKITEGPWQDFAGSLDEDRWNKSYPYQLLVLEANDQGGYKPRDGWQFTLPIPPEALSVSTQFPSRLDAALEGVVEQNGGVRFRYITLRGTTGVMPLRPTSAGAPANRGVKGIANHVFAGTIRNIRQADTNFQAILSGRVRRAPNLLDDEFAQFAGIREDNKIPNKGTGYMQFLLLEQFLLSYVEAKKKDAGKKLRLAFAVWKTNTVYLVQPLAFEAQQDASSPHERRYSLRFKAYARVDPNSLGVPDTEIVRPPSGRDPNLLSDVLNRIQSARRVLANVNQAIKSVRSDLATAVIGTVRQVVLFCKDALAIPATLADLPVGIAKDFHDAFNRNSPESFQQQLARSVDQMNSSVRASLDKIFGGSGQSEGVFSNIDDNYEFLSEIRPDMITLPDTTQQKIQAERAKVASFTRLDFEKARDSIVQASVEYADAVGAGHPTYDATYNRTAVTSKNKTAPADDDWEAIFALNELAIQTGRLASYADVDQQTTSPVEYIAGLARKSGISFTVPNSKFAVPFPYGSTLEQLAARYLGSPDRWHEIAALNNLRSPFVDEVGFDVPLLVNARGNSVVIGDATNLFLGQAVWLQGAGLARQKRHIQSIDMSVPGQAKILLDGDAVDQFTLDAKASLHASLPGTVNSQMLVFIPSDNEPNNDGNTKGVPGIDHYDHLLRVGGMDLLLTPRRDLAVTSDGDCRLAQGLTNIIQIVTINLNLRHGSLMRHPNLGFAILVGENTGDVSAQDYLDAAKTALSAYSMFSGVQNVLIMKDGPVAQIALSLGVKGVDDLLKISVDVEQ